VENELPGFEDASPLLHTLDALQECPYVQRAGLVGDHMRAITASEVTEESLKEQLTDMGVRGVRLEQVEPTLEDVFLALAGSD
jgi:hypothetical protein